MPRTRAGKLTKQHLSPSSTTNIGSHDELSEATYVLLRELSTRKLVTTELKLLSGAVLAKPLTSGRTISFRNGTGRGQKQGEIILVGTYNEVEIEMNNEINSNHLTKSSENFQQQDDSLEANHNDNSELISKSPILANVVGSTLTRSPPPLQSSIIQCSPVPYSSPTSSTAAAVSTTAEIVTSNSLPSKCSKTVINRISIHDDMIDTASSISVQRSSSLSSTLVPSVTKKAIKPTGSRSLVPSTTIKRKTSSGEALKEIKHLQTTVKAKDAEITKLTEQNKKLKQEVEKFSGNSIFIPSDDAVVQWVDYLYESIHKDEIRNQINLDTAADELGIERESIDLCLELAGGDRISTARQLFKYCTNYDEAIKHEHCWGTIDEDVVINICRFVREFFGVDLRQGDDYVRESLSNMMRKDSWKTRNPDKLKTKLQRSTSTTTKTSPQPSEEIYGDNDEDMNCDDDAHF